MNTRRDFIKSTAALCAALAVANPKLAAAMERDLSIQNAIDDADKLRKQGVKEVFEYIGERPKTPNKIAILVYEDMTIQDFVGPQLCLGYTPNTEIHLVSKDKTLKPLMGDTKYAIMPTTTIEDCPEDLDIFMVPGGGMGTVRVMNDNRSMEFVEQSAKRSTWVTSVCTGALILGQAGLLQGKKATTHWASVPVLDVLGAKYVEERVVVDGNLITGAGVSAGIDFGLLLVEKLRNRQTAEMVQLAIEYAPSPHILKGTPELADKRLVQAFDKVIQPYRYHLKDAYIRNGKGA